MNSKLLDLTNLQARLPYELLAYSQLNRIATYYVTALSDCLGVSDMVLYYPTMSPVHCYSHPDITWQVTADLWAWFSQNHCQHTWPMTKPITAIAQHVKPMHYSVPLVYKGRLQGLLFWSPPADSLAEPLTDSETRCIWQVTQVVSYIMYQLSVTQALTQTNRLALLGRIAASLAHEIKNPLVAIQAFVQLMPTHWDNPEFRAGFLDSVVTQLNQVTSLTTSLSQLGKTTDLVIKPVQLRYIIKQSHNILYAKLLASKMTLRNTVADNHCVQADHRALSQVLVNLIMNAIQAKKPGSTGTITLSATHLPSRYSAVSCYDDGIGMNETVKNHIHDPFFTTKLSGSGIGMTVIKQFLHAHCGQLSIDSHPTVGTTVTLYIPEPDANPDQFESDTGLILLKPEGLSQW